MKDIRPALRSYLLADAEVNALVGGSRIHHARLPQDQVEPSVVYHNISGIGDYHLQSDSGLGQVRMQIDSWAQSADAATELANAVYDRLTGVRGYMDTVSVKGTFLTSGRDDYDDVNRLYRISRDFIIWYGASA